MKRLAAVFTIVKDEKLYLPIWLSYYARHFSMEDIYVLDHQSTDGSTLNLSCNVRIIKNEKAFDIMWLLNVVKKFQSELLEKYEYVVFVESDEILIPLENSQYDLYDHIQMMKDIGRNFDVATGFELMQNTILEDSYDTSRPILSQRRHWYANEVYNKTLISNRPLDWTPGFHECQYYSKPNPDLILLHLHKFDYQVYMKRKLRTSSYIMADPLDPKESYQHRFTNIRDMRQFFYQDEHLLTQIPNDFPIVI